jgi:aryl carrier-like protein
MNNPEITLTTIWEEVLETSVLPADNFFDLGGDSIAAMQIVARAASVGITVRSADIFEEQTIEALVAKLADTQSEQTHRE